MIIKLPDEMVVEIKSFLDNKKHLGFESVSEFVRSAIRSHAIQLSSGVHLGMLSSCAYMRNVACLQHRTIHEFDQFVSDVMDGKPEFKQYQFDWNDRDALQIWIEKFYQYCKKEYQ